MLYQNADDEVLEGDIFTDLNEAELVGSTAKVTIVSQFDRYDGAFAGDGDWTGAKRFLVTQDDDLGAINSEEVEDLGEVDSGAPETLTEFMTWAITNYPAKKYALILSDHGAGWVGGWNDDAPEEGSALSIDEIDQALAAALAETGVDHLEFIGFDACLMSQVEALSGIAPYAKLRSRLGGNRARHWLGLRAVPGWTGKQAHPDRRRPGQEHRQILHRGRCAHPGRRRRGATIWPRSTARTRTCPPGHSARKKART